MIIIEKGLFVQTLNSYLGNLKRKLIKLLDIIVYFIYYLQYKTIINKNKCNIIRNKNMSWEFPKTIFAKNIRIKNILIILVYQYNLIEKYFCNEYLNLKSNIEISIWSNINFDTKILLSFSSDLSEGVLDLSYNYCGVNIYLLGFTMVPGYLFGISSPNAILISRMQVMRGAAELFAKCCKSNIGSNPQRNLFYAIMGIADKFKIDHLVCVNATNHIFFKKNISSFYTTYNNFFETFNGIKYDDNYYYLKLPYFEKQKLNNSSSHKRRRLIRRKFNDEIMQSVISFFDKNIHTSSIKNDSMNHYDISFDSHE